MCCYTSIKCIFDFVISITVIFLLFTEETLTLLETKLHRTLITIGEVSGKLDILIMNMSKLMRVTNPLEKKILRPERIPANMMTSICRQIFVISYVINDQNITSMECKNHVEMSHTDDVI